MAPELNIAVFEDDARYRSSIETLLGHALGMRCVASYPLLGPGMAAAERGPEPAWDLVLMDLELPDGSGIDAIRRLKLLRPSLPVVALTVFEEPKTILQTICAGADGYLLKRTPAGEVLAAIRAVAVGGSPLTPAVARTVLDVMRHVQPEGARPRKLDLTEREQEVLRALANGASYKIIAADLDISLDTVRTHIRALYRKLQVHSVAEAVGRAIREGLV